MSARAEDRFDLPADRWVSGPARAFLRGECHELLAPLRFRRPGELLDLTPRAVDRSAIAAELAATNTSYGHPRAAELAEKLSDPETLVVVTGQQAGVFGGPLLCLTKMAAAALWAERLEAEGRKAVGVFWVATEDHDFDEIARVVIEGADGPVDLTLGDDSAPLLPVGMRVLGAGVAELVEQTKALVGGDPEPRVWELLASTYRPDARIGEAFSKFMVGLLGERAPLLLDSMLPSLKTAQRPWLRRFVEQRDEVARALGEAAGRIESAGFSPQVPGAGDSSPLFRLEGSERRKIVWLDSEHYALRGDDTARPIQELLDTIDENPAAISPGVLARPVIQDAVLGTALQLMGPGELGYMAQASALYPVIGVDPPVTSLRPQMMVLPRAQRRKLEKMNWSLGAALADEESLERALGGDEIEALVARAGEDVRACLEQLREAAVAVDPQLERSWEKTRDGVRRCLDAFSHRARSAAARSDETAVGRLDSVRRVCVPLGTPQERTTSVASWALRCGPTFVDSVWRSLDVDSDCISIVDPWECPE